MTNSLEEPRVRETLTALAHAAETTDPAVLARLKDSLPRDGTVDDTDPRYQPVLRDAYIPVTLDVGRMLYILARAHGAKRIVEFGCSFGISTIHLAAAARDNGGRVITTEKEPNKAAATRENLQRAGLAEYVDVRLGDARETLAGDAGPIDFLFLDGWKALYLDVLRVVEARLRPGALVVGDDLDLARATMQPYLDYVRAPANGYSSVEIPIGDAMEISVRT